MNENKEKLTKDIKAKMPKKADKTVSNPLSKQLNELRKPALKTPESVKIDIEFLEGGRNRNDNYW